MARPARGSAASLRRGLRVVALLAGLAALAPAGADAPCERERFEGLEFTVCTADLSVHRLELFWKDEQGGPYAFFQRLPRERDGARLVFAMNAGMYRSDLTPVGLHVEGGERLRPANTNEGPGNFHLLPNGVFFVAGGVAGVLPTGRYLERDPAAELATQSGPMLVIDGELHPRFLADSDSRKRRNGVGVRNGETAVFAITETPVTFHEFARFFRDGLGCDNALYLDGSMSSLYAPALGRRDTIRPMGPIIGAYAPSGDGAAGTGE